KEAPPELHDVAPEPHSGVNDASDGSAAENHGEGGALDNDNRNHCCTSSVNPKATGCIASWIWTYWRRGTCPPSSGWFPQHTNRAGRHPRACPPTLPSPPRREFVRYSGRGSRTLG